MTRPVRRRRTLAGGALVGLAVALAGPGIGVIGQDALAAPAPAPPTASSAAAASCTPAQLAGTGSSTQIAGYTLDDLAAGFRYELDSPGLLPVGNPAQGNITEMDVPFAREEVTEGLVASRSSAAYPGDTAAGIGSALAEFGLNGVPNDPVLANAAYPPAPDAPASSTYPAGGEPGAANAGYASATASATRGTSESSISSFSLTSGGTVLTGGGPSESSTVADIGTACVDSSATADTSDIDIAGLVHISGVSAVAAARSDGTTAVPYAALHVGQVTVAGLDAYIDQNGIHLDDDQPVGYGVANAVQSELNALLRADGITVSLLAPTVSTTGADTTIDTGGIQVTVQTTAPATGVPGVPALSLPGAPPVPLGTPSAPVEYQVVYGAAQVTVDATRAPAFGTAPAGPASGTAASAPSGPAPAAPASTLAPPSSAPMSLGSVGGPGAPPTPASRLAAAHRSGWGGPVPVGWVIIGVLMALVLAAPLLGYARWQLLEGRI